VQPPVAQPRPVPPPASVPVAETPPPSSPAYSTDTVPGLLAPLVFFNRGLNNLLAMFGLPGRMLRSGLVKNLFGLAGIGLLLYTGAKVAQIHGWITLPIQLPWPK
jgi:hypothetical protein